jgi:hypothetical protein
MHLAGCWLVSNASLNTMVWVKSQPPPPQGINPQFPRHPPHSLFNSGYLLTFIQQFGSKGFTQSCINDNHKIRQKRNMSNPRKDKVCFSLTFYGPMRIHVVL